VDTGVGLGRQLRDQADRDRIRGDKDKIRGDRDKIREDRDMISRERNWISGDMKIIRQAGTRSGRQGHN